MGEKELVDVALEGMLEIQKTINETKPAPYEFPSADGRVAQLVVDSINTLRIIKKKNENN
jgi:hypothetical protein